MRTKANWGVSAVLPTVFGFLAGGVIIIQIVAAGPQVTPRETALFSVLQFVFAIIFAWLVSRAASRNEFLDSQKRFAVAAYRRINEIDEGAERLTSRVKNQMKLLPAEECRELEVVLAIAVGIRTSIKSSIADWGDVIGDEITTLEKIERIKSEQEMLLEDPSRFVGTAVPPGSQRPKQSAFVADAILKQLEQNEERMNKLLDQLPASLRIASGQRTEERSDSVAAVVQVLEAEFEAAGTLAFRGFWDPSFERDVVSLNVGDRLTVAVGDVGKRHAAMIAKDSDGKSVGVITNKCFSRYEAFREGLLRFLAQGTFEVELVQIKPRPTLGDRHYFEAKLVTAGLPWPKRKLPSPAHDA
jgi:hypothetical protein